MLSLTFCETEWKSKPETKEILDIPNEVESKQLRDLVDRYSFDWSKIARIWKGGVYDPLKCREIYLSLPTPSNLPEG